MKRTSKPLTPGRVDAAAKHANSDAQLETIIAYCSQDYQDALALVLDGWCRAASKVILYTNWPYSPPPKHAKQVDVQVYFERGGDWLQQIGRRPVAALHYATELARDGERLLFIDADCYILRPVHEVFQQSFSLAVSRLDTNKTVTCGLWFARYSERLLKFLQRWHELSQAYRLSGKGVVAHRPAYEQLAFDELVRQANLLPTVNIPWQQYNCEDDHRQLMLALIQQHKPSIIHFKCQWFRSPDFVTAALRAAQ